MKMAFIGAALLAGISVSAAAQVVAVNDSTNALVSLDPLTGAQTAIGSLGVGGDFGDLAWTGSTLYWIGGRGNAGLYTVDTGTGAATLVGNHGINDLFGLAWDPVTSSLYGTQFAGGSGFYRIDAGTGAATFIGDTGIGIGGLTYNSITGQLVGTNDGGGDFYAIDRNTGALTLLGGAGGLNDSDSAFDAGTDTYLTVDWSGNFFRTNLAGPGRTLIASLGAAFDGIAILAPVGPPGPAVPEPASWAMLIAGFGLVGAIARRRRTVVAS